VVTTRTVVLVLILLTACGSQNDGNYIDEYGGSSAVYQRIATETDCAALQAEFDQAAANNDAADPGTSQHRQTTGYMRAADDRMREVGCYE
jgi:hypothetical protein